MKTLWILAVTACLAVPVGATAQDGSTRPVETAPVGPAPDAPDGSDVATEEAPARQPLRLPDLSESNTRSAGGEGQPDARAAIPKALRSSGTQAGGPANDFNPSGVPQAPVEAKGALGAVIAGQALFHGNYCGAGQRGVALPPTDDLDAACMRHDACYDGAGYRSCGCDRTLRQEASAVSERPGVPLEVRRRALSVAEAASVMECRQP